MNDSVCNLTQLSAAVSSKVKKTGWNRVSAGESVLTLKTEICQDDNFVVIGGAEGCRNDNVPPVPTTYPHEQSCFPVAGIAFFNMA